jgi:septal ring factor EnvC (AmiA/AmiB activator)
MSELKVNLKLYPEWVQDDIRNQLADTMEDYNRMRAELAASQAEVERLRDQWEKLLVEVEDLTSELPEGKDTLDDVVAAVKLMCDQRDYAIEDAALCRAEVARKDKKIAAISYAYNELMNYRGKNTLNFQLEKLDDYLHILAIAIAEARDD